MALFQRIKTPFVEPAAEHEARPPSGPRSAGDVLRRRREALALDIGACARSLNIKPGFLAALEDGQPERLPGPTYAFGWVRAYGDHLGLDGQALLRRFKAESNGFDKKPDLSFPMPLGERSVPGGSMLLVALILAICGYGTWYYLSTAQRGHLPRVSDLPLGLLPPKPQSAAAATAPDAAPPVRAPAETSAAAAEAAPPPKPELAATNAGEATKDDARPQAPADAASTVTAMASTESPAAPAQASVAIAAPAVADPTPAPSPAANPPPAAAAASVPAADAAPQPAAAEAKPAAPGHSYGIAAGARIVIRAIADSWIQVRAADQSTLFTRMLKAGDSYGVPDKPGLSMRTGNAGGLDIVVDGRPAPALGKAGMLRRDVSLEPEALTAGTAVHD